MATQNRNEIVMSNLEDYETLYKVDLNFDADVSKLSPEVMTDYIVRVLANHPYYINVNNIVDVLVNEGSNTVTVVVSTRDVQEKIVNMTNDSVTLNSVNERNNVISEESQQKLNLVSANLNDKKFVLETTDNKGEPRMYEYEFSGFGKAKNLFIEKSVKMGGNKYRHFLRNNNDNPYFYDEYMNSEIVYSPDNKINMLERKIDQIERNVYGNDFSPNNVESVKSMLEHSVNNASNIPKPTQNVINNNVSQLNMSMPINSNNNLLPINNMTMQVANNTVNGVNLNNMSLPVNSVNLNNMTLPVNGVNVNNMSIPVNHVDNGTHAVNNVNNNGVNHVNNNGMNHVNNGVNHVNNGVNHVNNGVNHVNNGMNHVNNGVNHVNNGVNHVNNGMNHVNGVNQKENNIEIEEEVGEEVGEEDGIFNNVDVNNESPENNVEEEEEDNKYEINDELTKELNDAIDEPKKQDLGISKYIIVFLVTILLIILFILIFELLNNRRSLFKARNTSNV